MFPATVSPLFQCFSLKLPHSALKIRTRTQPTAVHSVLRGALFKTRQDGSRLFLYSYAGDPARFAPESRRPAAQIPRRVESVMGATSWRGCVAQTARTIEKSA
jgi:transposase